MSKLYNEYVGLTILSELKCVTEHQFYLKRNKKIRPFILSVIIIARLECLLRIVSRV